jgi:hypothetical protein
MGELLFLIASFNCVRAFSKLVATAVASAEIIGQGKIAALAALIFADICRTYTNNKILINQSIRCVCIKYGWIKSRSY